MKRIALVIASLFAAHAAAMTFEASKGFTLLVCDDVVFTHYTNGGWVHGTFVPAESFVLTCPRTNATWHLNILGCPNHKVSRTGPGALSFTC